MKDITIIVIGQTNISLNDNIELLCSNGKDIIDIIKKAKGKYITFLSDNDYITENYIEKIKEKIQKDFDCCYINFDYSLEEKNNNKILTNEKYLKERKPYYKEYLFSYIFKKEKLDTLINLDDISKFNETVDNEFKNIEVIEEVIYYHNPKQKRRINDFIYSDVKKIKKYNNIIYVASGCKGIFNGYVSWIRELGKCYKGKYEVAVLYDLICDQTKNNFEKYFKCVKRENDTIYLCNRLLVTYTSYFYPKNIVNLNKSYLFIHGNMSDFPNAAKYYDDIYTNYVAVSKTAKEKAVGYFPTDTIEYVLNPFKQEKVKQRLKLTSTLRTVPIKRIDRIEKMAKLMDELDIPYTWEIFTDKKENTNVKGLIYRQRVSNPLPYVQDSDYFVLLSDSESFSYSVLEALSVNTKVIVTPLPVYKEIGVKDKTNATIIPFEYFEDGNEEKLKKVILEIYRNKNRKIEFKVKEELQSGYNKIFT